MTKGNKMLEKKELRKNIIERRNKMPSAGVQSLSAQRCERILDLEEYKQADNVLVYMSVNNEVDLKLLIDDAIESVKYVYIPKVVSKTEMKFYLYDGAFSEGSFGILEPKNCDEDTLFSLDDDSKTLVIIPGVAFDSDRNRLGYGGGFYDGFLSKLGGGNVSKLAVAYELQIVDKVPSEEHDLKSDAIITEKRIIM